MPYALSFIERLRLAFIERGLERFQSRVSDTTNSDESLADAVFTFMARYAHAKRAARLRGHYEFYHFLLDRQKHFYRDLISQRSRWASELREELVVGEELPKHLKKRLTILAKKYMQGLSSSGQCVDVRTFRRAEGSTPLCMAFATDFNGGGSQSDLSTFQSIVHHLLGQHFVSFPEIICGLMNASMLPTIDKVNSGMTLEEIAEERAREDLARTTSTFPNLISPPPS